MIQSKMKNHLLKIGIILLVLSGTAMVISPQDARAQRSSEEIKQLLEDRDNEIKELVGPKGTEYTQEQRDKLKDIINGIVDYRAMAQFASSKPTTPSARSSERSLWISSQPLFATSH